MNLVGWFIWMYDDARTSSSYSTTALLVWPWHPLELMPIPLFPMLSFSIVSHRVSSGRLPHHLSTWIWVVLCLFVLLIFLQRSSLQTWSGLIHSTHVSKPFQSSNLYYVHDIWGFVFGHQFFVRFNSALYILCTLLVHMMHGLTNPKQSKSLRERDACDVSGPTRVRKLCLYEHGN